MFIWERERRRRAGAILYKELIIKERKKRRKSDTMKRRRAYTVEEALRLLQNIDEDQSDGGEVSEFEAESDSGDDSDYEPGINPPPPARRAEAAPATASSATGKWIRQNICSIHLFRFAIGLFYLYLIKNHNKKL